MLPEDKAQLLEAAERESGIKAQMEKFKAAGELPALANCVNPSCSQPIPEGRRLAYPGVRLCTSCKGFSEKYGRLP